MSREVNKLKKEIASRLISLGCFQVSHSPLFNYASGEKGPVYCDNRRVLSHPQDRKVLASALVDSIKDWGGEFDSVVGIATGGLPWASMVAEELGCPLHFVRPGAKKHGLGKLVEGDFRPKEKVILIEDLVNKGHSLDKAIEATKEAELIPLACFCLVSYQRTEAMEVCREQQIKLVHLTSLKDLLGALVQKERIDDEGQRVVSKWLQNSSSKF